jgi:hypothetical protein
MVCVDVSWYAYVSWMNVSWNAWMCHCMHRGGCVMECMDVSLYALRWMCHGMHRCGCVMLYMNVDVSRYAWKKETKLWYNIIRYQNMDELCIIAFVFIVKTWMDYALLLSLSLLKHGWVMHWYFRFHWINMDGLCIGTSVFIVKTWMNYALLLSFSLLKRGWIMYSYFRFHLCKHDTHNVVY